MPISLIEAMAAGLPAVATDIVGNRDLLADTGAGTLVGTPREMIGSLMEFIQSSERRRITGRRARELVERKYSAARMVESFLWRVRDRVSRESLLECTHEIV